MTKPGATLVRKDTGLSKLFTQLRQLDQLSVTVGVQGQDVARTYPDGTTVGVVAMANEFGTDEIPSRPFLRRAAQLAEAGAAEDVAAKSISNVIESGDAVRELSAVGRELLELVLDQFDDPSWAQPDDGDTVAEKHSSKPLTDTGLLRDSQSWAVRRGDQIVAQGRR